MNSKAPKSVS